MAKLSAFKRNTARTRADGEWVAVGDEYDDLEIKTRGFTDEYTDRRAASFRKAALRYGGDVAKIPSSTARDLTIDALVAECLLDVRNLVDNDGKPVTVTNFAAMLKDPDYTDLYIATLTACGMAGRARADEAAADVKN